jgi:hypothetical protein
MTPFSGSGICLALSCGRKGSKDITNLIESCEKHGVPVEVMSGAAANARFPDQLKLEEDFVAAGLDTRSRVCST